MYIYIYIYINSNKTMGPVEDVEAGADKLVSKTRLINHWQTKCNKPVQQEDD